MELLMPVSNISQLETYLESGIREFYCGYLPLSWIRKYNQKFEPEYSKIQCSINRREYVYANFTDPAELEKAQKLCDQKGAKLFLTLNAMNYPEYAYSDIRDYLHEVSGLGIKRLIAGDTGLLNLLFQEFPEFLLTISCTTQIFNKEAVRFFLDFHPERLVLPRHVTCREAKTIIDAFPDEKFEIFLISNRCFFDDGSCRCLHDLGSVCQDQWKVRSYPEHPDEWIGRDLEFHRFNSALEQELRDYSLGIEQTEARGFGGGEMVCSICSLSVLAECPNLESVKLVGRGSVYSDEEVRLLQEICKTESGDRRTADYRNYARRLFGFTDLCESGLFCLMGADHE